MKPSPAMLATAALLALCDGTYRSPRRKVPYAQPTALGIEQREAAERKRQRKLAQRRKA